MALKNGEQYVESLARMRPNIYKWGQLIQDVTTDPATRLHTPGGMADRGWRNPGMYARGGSPDGAKLVVRARTPWEQYAAEARRIAGITAELADPTPANK